MDQQRREKAGKKFGAEFLYVPFANFVRYFIAMCGFAGVLMASEWLRHEPPDMRNLRFVAGMFATGGILAWVLVRISDRSRTRSRWMEMFAWFGLGLVLGVVVPVIHPLLEKLGS